MRLRTTCDNKLYMAKAPEQMVMHLWKAAFIEEVSPEEYMAAVARRTRIYNGFEVRTDTAQHFLDDLAEAGIVVIEPNDYSTGPLIAF
jgi:hypothetical protein